MRSLIYTFAFFIFGLGIAQAHEYEAGDVTVHHPYSYAVAKGEKSTSVYMTITNDGETPDRLLKVTSPVSDQADLQDGNQKIDFIEIGPHESKRFKPDGFQIVLNGVKGTIKIGQRKPIILFFEKAGQMNAQILFSKPGKISHCEMPNTH